MSLDPDLNNVVTCLALAKIILPPVVKLLKLAVNKSITVIVITRDK